MRKSIKNLTLGIVAFGAFALTACMSGNSNPAASNEEGYATVVVQTKAGTVKGLSKPGLGKTSVITLDSLYVTAISNATSPTSTDTVRIKLAVGDSNFSSDPTADQTVNIVLNLKALRSWTISARTVDVNDSIIQSGTVLVPSLFAGQTRVVNLSATPRYTIYNATFNFPDSIFSPNGLFGQKVSPTRIELLVDDAVVADEEGASILGGEFLPATNYVLSYDYVAPSADSVTLKVFGLLTDATSPWDSENLLYSKTVAISSLVAAFPTPNTVPLTWRGPSGGVANLAVAITKVGTVNIDGVTPPVVLSKK